MNAIRILNSRLSPRRMELFLAVPVLLALVLFSFLMRYQGWRSRYLNNWDMLVYYLGAESMIHDGVVMEKGDLSSYHSFQPPGMVYLVWPSALAGVDPRLFDLLGDVIVNSGAMLFLYLILRESFGGGLAFAACAVYGCSRLVFMGIWPIGHPFYAFAVLWFLMRWIRRRSAWWLFGALVIGAFGLYVDLSILPFLFVLPVLWILFRPPLRTAPILAAGAAAFLIWLPYLRFESTRGFVDLKSILHLTEVSQVDSAAAQTPTYCYASLPGEMDSIHETYIPFIGNGQGMDRVVFYEPGLENYHRICWLLSNLDRNFDGGYFLTENAAVSAGLWFLFLSGLFISAGMALRPLEDRLPCLERLRRWNGGRTAGVILLGALLVYWLADPGLLARFTADGSIDRSVRLDLEMIRWYAPLLLAAGGLGLIIGMKAPRKDLKDIAPILIVWIPWLILVFAAERTRSERFFWIWAMQAAVMVFAAFQIVAAVTKNAKWKIPVVVALAVLVFPLSYYRPVLQEWSRDGWSETDSVQIRLVDYLHERILAEGGGDVSLGFAVEGMDPSARSVDDRFRPGSWFDFLLEARWGIRNRNAAPLGIEPGDGWRILQTDDPSLTAPPPWEGYTAVKAFGNFVLFQKTD